MIIKHSENLLQRDFLLGKYFFQHLVLIIFIKLEKLNNTIIV